MDFQSQNMLIKVEKSSTSSEYERINPSIKPKETLFWRHTGIKWRSNVDKNMNKLVGVLRSTQDDSNDRPIPRNFNWLDVFNLLLVHVNKFSTDRMTGKDSLRVTKDGTWGIHLDIVILDDLEDWYQVIEVIFWLFREFTFIRDTQMNLKALDTVPIEPWKFVGEFISPKAQLCSKINPTGQPKTSFIFHLPKKATNNHRKYPVTRKIPPLPEFQRSTVSSE